MGIRNNLIMKREPVRFFPAQQDSEKVLYVIKRHWFTYMTFWLIAFIMALPIILGLVFIPFEASKLPDDALSIFLLIGSTYTLLVLSLLLYGFIDFYLDIYIITDRRIVDIKQNGLFNRTISELNLRQVQDVKAIVKGIFPTLMHYGEVFIQTAGERENFNFKDVPHPYRISKLILDLHEIASKSDGTVKCLERNKLAEIGTLPNPLQDFNEGFNQVVKENCDQIEKPANSIDSLKSEDLVKTSIIDDRENIKDNQFTNDLKCDHSKPILSNAKYLEEGQQISL